MVGNRRMDSWVTVSMMDLSTVEYDQVRTIIAGPRVGVTTVHSPHACR